MWSVKRKTRDNGVVVGGRACVACAERRIGVRLDEQINALRASGECALGRARRGLSGCAGAQDDGECFDV